VQWGEIPYEGFSCNFILFLFSGRLRWKSGQRHQTLAEMFLQVAGSNPATAEIHDL
jgi:hypothetical protein